MEFEGDIPAVWFYSHQIITIYFEIFKINTTVSKHYYLEDEKYSSFYYVNEHSKLFINKNVKYMKSPR